MRAMVKLGLMNKEDTTQKRSCLVRFIYHKLATGSDFFSSLCFVCELREGAQGLIAVSFLW